MLRRLWRRVFGSKDGPPSVRGRVIRSGGGWGAWSIKVRSSKESERLVDLLMKQSAVRHGGGGKATVVQGKRDSKSVAGDE